jgi:hypothetical protein
VLRQSPPEQRVLESRAGSRIREREKTMSKLGLVAGAALLGGALVASAQPLPLEEVRGRVVDVTRNESGGLEVLLVVDDEQELTLLLTPDSRVSIEGEALAHEELGDVLDTEAKALYRETASALLVESLQLSWPAIEEE